jgi:hypothetical protein
VFWALSVPSRGAQPAASIDSGDEIEAAQPRATSVAASTQAKPNPAKPAVQPPAPLPMVDLFAGAMPDFMAEAHTDVLAQKWLDASRQKELYNWGREHRDDARPQLLLAWDSMNRDWKGIAVRMYGIAYRADHRAKDDPSMLRDLVSIASQYDTVEYREASALLREAFGAQAVPRIDDEIATLGAQGDNQRVDRLKRLRSEMTTSR